MCDPDMCRFVNAGMHGDETTQHLRIGSVYDGIGRKSCDIPLPEGDMIRMGMPASLVCDRRDI